VTLTTTHVLLPAVDPVRGSRAPLLPAPRRAPDLAAAPRRAAAPRSAAARRHAAVVLTGAAALPVLALLGLAHDHSVVGVLAALLGPAALLAAAGLPARPTRGRGLAAAAGLVAACSTAVSLSPSTTELHFSFLLAVVLLGVYRDAACFAVAAAVAALWPDLAAAVGDPGDAAAVAGVVVLHLTLVVAAAAVAVVGWALADADSRDA
jgi:hypothetical protein